MEEHYRGTVILVTAGPADRESKWKSTCKIKFMQGAREVVKDLELALDYDAVEQAERAGMVFSKKWVDAVKPNLVRSCPKKRVFFRGG
jgi:hypothetical protein